jgi:predicted PurR-regulated permease PerM
MEPAPPAETSASAEPVHERPVDESRAARRSQRAFWALFAVAFALTAAVMWPFRVPLLLAAVLASVTYGVFERLCRLFHGRRWAAALTVTLGLLVTLLGPVAALGTVAAQQLTRGLRFVREQLAQHAVSQHTLEQIERYAGTASSWAERGLHEVLSSSTQAAFHIAVTLLATYFLLIEGRRLVRWLRRVSPLEAEETEELLTQFRSVARATILGAAIAALYQAVAATAGYLLVGVPHAVFFGLLTLVASFVPLVGAPLVWLPMAVFLWVLGHHGSAVGLVVWCVVMVSSVEHIGKPVVLRRLLHSREQMHTGLVFLSLLGGVYMFGPVGLVLGPLVVAFFLAMVRMYEHRTAPAAGH